MKVKIFPIAALVIAAVSGVFFASNQKSAKDRQSEATLRNVEAVANEEEFRNPCLMFTTCDCTYEATFANGDKQEVTIHDWIHEDDPMWNWQ
ncbi:MAG: hypothetical protein K2I18_06565 [Paramuribaculum sp.]|nr:hypothetical protein [Paramuribaculum sp.]